MSLSTYSSVCLPLLVFYWHVVGELEGDYGSKRGSADCAADLTNKQEAGELHTQWERDVTFYCSCHDTVSSVYNKIFFSWSLIYWISHRAPLMSSKNFFSFFSLLSKSIDLGISIRETQSMPNPNEQTNKILYSIVFVIFISSLAKQPS